MCGRIVQHGGMEDFFSELAPRFRKIGVLSAEPIGRYNVPPGTKVQILRGLEDGIHVDAVKWGWAPAWAKTRPNPNARIEKLTGRFYSQLWPNKRAITPSEGWYEWPADPNDPDSSQPYFIRLKSQKPMFFASLAQVHDEPGQETGNGFVIITDASDQGMLDIHDRRPVVLSPEDACAWLDPATPPERAEDIARHCARPVDDFEWYAVGKAVGNSKNQGPGLIAPIT